MLEEESETLCSISLTDEVELSFDGKWLRKYFKLPLKMGIKEIVARKPCDPVTYLGFWLLNYRRCQERRQWQLEKDNELNYLRSMIEEPVSKEEEFSVSIREEEEEEEGMRDWNFKRYETMHE
ncbi:DPY30 domain-containing protein 1-like [Bombus huntii]|uniref:DPY30 domain-containing protein 1-like n=1 Tax=Bombus huntii TaxID=85661 RepID=UPI0021A9E58C|nr:DPY30 domain-containing protein 1-like [Bombus huntii]